MARVLVEAARICGWHEPEDLRFRGLVYGLIEMFGLRARYDKHGRITRID
jgi:hypothetical protein